MKRILASSTMSSACFVSSKEPEERRGAPYKKKGLEHRVVVEQGGQNEQVSVPLPGWP